MWNPGWDKIFQQNEWGRYPPEELVRFVARNYYSLPDRSAIRILEIGCGPGANLWFLGREGFAVHGLDGSEVGLQRAKSRLEQEGIEAVLCRGDAMEMPYPDGSFNCVIDVECIYANSLKDSRRIIREVHRVLEPGGTFFSKAFMTGTYGDGNGTLMDGEPHTFVDIREGALHRGYGIIRFTAEEEILDLYGVFAKVEYDRLIRSDKNRQYEVREWLITCRK